MESSLLPASPAATPAPYLGGKRNLARRVIARLGAIPHTTYVEPFIGMGGIFLRRPFRAKAEVINDISTDVANLFRILQRHYVPLMDMLRWQLTSRSEWQRLNAANPDTLTDLERAARFLYLQRLCFGGKVSGRTFGVTPGVPARFDVAKLASTLEEVHERLSGVVIERLPYAELLRRYDRPGTLFYCDPPYWDCETDYGEGVFARGDFELLADALAGLKGRFLLSLNDTPGVREVFGRFSIEEVDVTYSVGQHAARRPPAREVLISGPAA
ncbi:DNA adenine methylase [Pararoseomonas sp. SCSIO 73927]|uniref:DNA adenine methylase n=1 Tax=Pararoseomonas sp. SCSIO 73927 TaxID=3114537 RepID=UPI0030D4C656